MTPAMDSKNGAVADGVHGVPPRERMSDATRKLRDTYAITPGAPLVRREFGFYCLDRWKEQGMPPDVPMAELFHYDDDGRFALGALGWCEAAFCPPFETLVLEDRGQYELVQDHAGRQVLCFKGRRSGFMPEYLDHPVKDMRTWIDDVRWRMDPTTPDRWNGLAARLDTAVAAAAEGRLIVQNLIGGYMYLRSLIGPEALLYFFYDHPDVVHDCMRAWFTLADTVIERHQQRVTIDEIFFAEDICYNHGSLISPDMMREFLLPYYQQVIANLRRRQIDRARRLFVQIDTDGFADPVIPLYRESIGMNVMSPFEVAAGCDVLRAAADYPDLVITGGIDKRELAKGRKAIDRMVERILPPMRARGGYIPTSDHGVPEEVPYADYRHYRQRCIELGG